MLNNLKNILIRIALRIAAVFAKDKLNSTPLPKEAKDAVSEAVDEVLDTVEQEVTK